MPEIHVDAVELAKKLQEYCADRRCSECDFLTEQKRCAFSMEPIGWEV